MACFVLPRKGYSCPMRPLVEQRHIPPLQTKQKPSSLPKNYEVLLENRVILYWSPANGYAIWCTRQSSTIYWFVVRLCNSFITTNIYLSKFGRCKGLRQSQHNSTPDFETIRAPLIVELFLTWDSTLEVHGVIDI